MKLRLISNDRTLYQRCREVLLEFRDREWDFGMMATPAESGEADILVWDCQPEVQLPENLDLEEESRNIFLVDRKCLSHLRERFPLAALRILLKPVNQVLLRAFLEEAVAGQDARNGQPEGDLTQQLRQERDEMLQCLLQANLKLQEYDQDRSSFLAHSVHDFRAPLMAVHGYCKLLLDRQLGPLTVDQVKVLERMQHSVQRLSRLASSMFHLSVGRRIDSKPRLRNGDIEDCIAQAVHEVSSVAESRGVEIRVQTTPPTEPLWFDGGQIEQVLVNLLDNACRFTKKSGRIDISALPEFWDRRAPHVIDAESREERRGDSRSRKPNAYRVEVHDTGSGIAPDDLERIFEEYTTGSNHDHGAHAGLGLAICRQIITAHQGRVFAESNGRGASFVFVLPYAPREARALPPEKMRSRSTARVSQ
ncbi:MAG: HAMP domain-containing histidine kinase [Acidobacteria bacterium]|nr:HAMP domain-containing histidine kinase [Acidobacteriota bacterium]